MICRTNDIGINLDTYIYMDYPQKGETEQRIYLLSDIYCYL